MSAPVRRVIAIEGSVNLAVFLAKVAVGLSTGSLAVISDAIHSLADIANNVVAWFVVRASAQPPDHDHPYGHQKFEMLAVFGLATLLAVVAVEMTIHALSRLAQPASSDFLSISIMGGVMAANIALATWEFRRAKRLDSPILRADAIHTFADVATTVAVIAGWQLSALGWPFADVIAAIAISGFVLWLALGLYRRAIPGLTDSAAVDADVIARAVLRTAGVEGIGRIRSRWIGSDRAADIVVFVPADFSNTRCHAIADDVEERLANELGINDVSVHVEPAKTEPDVSVSA